MASNSSHSHQRPRRSRRIGIMFIVGILVLFVTVGILYAYVSSSIFFRQWIEPQIEKNLGYPVVIESVDYSPLGKVHLKNMTMEKIPGEENSRLTLSEFDLRFRILPLLQKQVEIKRLYVDSLNAWITKTANGEMIGPVAGKKKDEEEEEEDEDKDKDKEDESGWRVELSNLELKNIAAKYDDFSKNSRQPDIFELTDFGLNNPNLVLGEHLKATGGGRFHIVQPGEKQTDLAGRLAIKVDQIARDAKTDQIQGQVEVADLLGRYNGQNLQGFRALVVPAAEITNGEILKTGPLSIKIESNGKPWAQADIFANWNLKEQSGDVRAELKPVDRRLLNLLAPPDRRLDFRQTQLSGTFSAVFGSNTVLREIKGNAVVRNLNPTGRDLPPSGFPVANADIDFAGEFPDDEDHVLLKTLIARVSQAPQGEVLSINLQKQLQINKETMMPVPGKIGENALLINVRNLNLAQWQAVLPRSTTRFQSGLLTANLNVGENPQAPGSIAISGKVATANLKGQSANRAFGPLSSQSDLAATLSSERRLDIRRFITAISSRGQSMGTLSFAGSVQQKPLQGDINATMQNIRLDAWPLPPSITSKYAISGGILSGKAGADMGHSQINLNPDITIQNLTLAPKKPGAKPLQNISADLKGQLNLAQSDQGAIRSVDFRSLQLNARGPNPFFALSANGKLDLQKGSGQIKMNIAQADIARLMSFQGVSPETAEVEQGNLKADLTIAMREQNNLIVTGQAQAKPLTILVTSEGQTKRLSIPLRMDIDQSLNTQSSQLNIRKLRMEIENPNGQPGTLDVTGNLRYNPALDGTITAKGRDFQMLPLLPFLPPAVSEQADLRVARLTALDEQITLTGKNKSGSAKGSMALADVHPPVEKRKKDIALALAINNNVRFTPTQILLDQVQIDVTAPGEQPSRIDVKGAMPRGQSGQPGNLTVVSNSVHLQPLLLFAGKETAPNAPPLNAQNLKMDVALGNEGTVIRNFQSQLAGGNVTFESVTIGKAQGDAPAPIRWNQLKAAGLDVPTIVANFVPKQNGKISGKAEFESSGSARGFTEEAMAQFLRSTANAQIKDGQLRGFPMLEQLAQVTNIPELRNFGFFQLQSSVKTAEDGVQVQDIYLTGPTQKLRLRGRIEYDKDMRINLELGLAGALADRVRNFKYVQFLQPDKDGYLVFPTPFAVSGKLGAPRIKFTIPTESLMNIGSGVLHQELQRRLGGQEGQAATGETTGTAPTAAPGTRPAATPGSLLDIGTGLLQQELEKRQGRGRDRRQQEPPAEPLPTQPTEPDSRIPNDARTPRDPAESTPPPAPPAGQDTPRQDETDEPSPTDLNEPAPTAPPAEPTPNPKPTQPPSLLDIGTGILQQQLEERQKRE